MKSFLELTKGRYSVREYLPKNVEEERLAYVMECVRMAPSACNNQPAGSRDRYLILVND